VGVRGLQWLALEVVCGSERFTMAGTSCPRELETWGREGHKREINQDVGLAVGRKCR
jgi:hypothetical protein